MVIYKNMEIHGAEEIFEKNGGVSFMRMPEKLHGCLTEPGLKAVRRPGGCEIRFVPEGEVYITISTDNDDAYSNLTVYYGSMQRGTLWSGNAIVGKTPRRLRFCPSPAAEFLGELSEREKYPFSPEVVRIVCDGTPIVIHSVEGKLRPPTPEEKPAKTMLFYGSSICHGAAASAGDLFWPFRTAAKLGIDHINLGMPNAGIYQHGMADFIASRTDWDYLFLEIGINFYGDPYEVQKERTEYMLKTVRAAHPDKYIFCTDIFCARCVQGEMKEHMDGVRKTIRDAVLSQKDERIVYINALDIMGSDTLLSEDRVHPSTEGHITISDNLYKALKKYF